VIKDIFLVYIEKTSF